MLFFYHLKVSVVSIVCIFSFMFLTMSEVVASDNLTTQLFEASKSGNIDEVKSVIKQGVDVNSKGDQYGETVLLLASLFGRLDIVRLLIDNGADVNMQSKNGSTALMRATENKSNIEIVRFLIEKGADVNTKDSDGKTAYHYAKRNKNLEIIQLLIKSGINIDINEQLLNSSIKGNLLEVKSLINKGADVNAKIGYYDCMFWEESNGPQDITALNASSSRGYLEIVETLVKSGADINAFGSLDENGCGDGTALMHASGAGYLDVVRFLVENGAEIDNKKLWQGATTPLIYASRVGHLDIVRYLVENGAEVNAQDKKGKTALDYTRSNEIGEYLSNIMKKYNELNYFIRILLQGNMLYK